MLTAHLAELIGALNAFIAGFRHDSVQIAVLKHLHALNGGAAGASTPRGSALPASYRGAAAFWPEPIMV